MKIILLDAYVDEPACLGVPPFISPYVRYTAGAIKDSGHDFIYLTIDEYRKGTPKIKALTKRDLLVIIGGALVPGKYLRGTPASIPEIRDIANNFKGTKILGGPIARFGYSGDRKVGKLSDLFDFMPEKDPDAFIFDLLTDSSANNRLRTEEEWQRWAIKGSSVISQHPDFPTPLIIELESYRGCVRHQTGGCSFCIEPLFGEPVTRKPKDIIQEVGTLHEKGAVNFRLGAQSCIFSYGTEELGTSETPKPNTEKVEKLLSGIRSAAPNLQVLHTDNANPAVIAEHPEEAKKILKTLVEYCTSGNVLALGMESADPEVIRANNLNATPKQVETAVELINKYGSQRGDNGLPKLLPGINFLSGLRGETKITFELNFQFLEGILKKGLLLRRINIRQVAQVREKFNSKKHHAQFMRFKKKVREEIDKKMLTLVVPLNTVMRDVLIEKVKGNYSFGRQVGTYPLLVGISYKLETGKFREVMITDHGFRSVTGIEHPMNVNTASLKALSCLPGIGKKRAARIARFRPFSSNQDFINSLDDEALAKNILRYITF